MMYRCISNDNYVGIKLTIGKVYTNLFPAEFYSTGDTFLYIEDDRGIENYVDIDDFILLSEIRDNKLNQLGI